MFKIILSPQAGTSDDTPPTVNGDILTYRGVDYDLSPLPEGGSVEAGLPFVGNITKVNGVINLTMQYQYNWDTSLDDQPMDWAAYTFELDGGQCPCPILRREVVVTKREIDSIEIKTNPFNHIRASNLLTTALAEGIEVQSTQTDGLWTRTWTIEGTHEELVKFAELAKQYNWSVPDVN